MEKLERKLSTMEALRVVAPGWFIIAGIACGLILNLKGMQFFSAVMFGLFLTDLTYAIFFEQTLGLLTPKPAPNYRYIMMLSAAVVLLLIFFFLGKQ